MTERAAPFYCPYCGDENLRRRVFRLGYVGVAANWTSVPEEASQP
jgi:hypothetical protein